MKATVRRPLGVLLVGAAAALGLTGCIPPDFSVNTTADLHDTAPGNGECRTSAGNCSLRAAIEESNARDGREYVLVPAGTYRLTISTSLTVSGPMALEGAGPNQTFVDGNDRYAPVLLADSPSGGQFTVNITGMTFRNGNAVGVFVDTEASLTLSNGKVTGNDALTGGGIVNNGFVQLFDSTVANNGTDGGTARGGGIANTSSAFMEIYSSTISGNASTGGAGINNSGRLELKNSTVSGNRAGRGGGGIQNTGLLYLSSSTIASNEANSRLDLSNADAFGGGVKNVGGTVYAWNTIIANNADHRTGFYESSSAPDCYGPVNSDGHNIVGNNRNCTWAADFGDQIGTPASPVDPRLSPLGNNGGPTNTHGLQFDSPAIDEGWGGAPDGAFPACYPQDQRGRDRNFDGDGDGTAVCDIGSFERQKVGP